jgi:hypothetical protein
MHSRFAAGTGNRPAVWLLLACVLFGQSGCAVKRMWEDNGGFATKNLWDKRKGEARYRPSHDAKLQLHAAPATDDVLVQYEERKVSTYKPRTRAYFLFANATQMAAGKPPTFVNPAKFKALKPVPIHKTPPTATAPEATYYAVLRERPWEFEVRRGEQSVGVFMLPIYDGDRNTVPALLTPAALAVDASMGAAYTATLALALYGLLLGGGGH